jgi:hypothetical protein
MSEFRKMVQNRVWATAYNLVAIPVATGIFLRRGLALPMSLWDGDDSPALLTVYSLQSGRGFVSDIRPRTIVSLVTVECDLERCEGTESRPASKGA